MHISPDIYPEHSIILAPLSGYTDLAFRRACRRYGCFYAFTPLIEAGSVVYAAERTAPLLLRGEDEPWLGAQLLGANPERLAAAARFLRERHYDLIDLNMGCPVRKVTRRNAGAALCYDPALAEDCIRAVVENSGVPVTAKMRIISQNDSGPTIALAQRLQAAGIAVLTVHGRIMENLYSGPVAFHVIRDLQAALDIPVVANGGVMNHKSARELREKTGCSRLMIARGAIGNPWIFQQINLTAPSPGHTQICDVIEYHVREMLELYPEGAALRKARKIILAYLVGRGYRRSRRDQVKHISTWPEFQEFLAGVRSEGPLTGRSA